MSPIKFLRRRAAKVMAPVIDEPIYFQLFQDALRRLDLPLIYRPFGAAANASMLFVTLRCVELGRPARVLDIGAGQSSLLLDALSDRLPMEIHSLEPEAAWRDAVARRVRHPVHHCPLEMRRHQGHAFGALPLPAVLRGLRFDLVLVDGPAGAPRFARYGVADLIPDNLGDQAAILFDDAERRGTAETVRAVLGLLGRRGIEMRRLMFHGRASQALLAPAAATWLDEI